MLLSQFEDCSPTEESCMSYFRDVRIDQDISCPIVGEKLISSFWGGKYYNARDAE